MSFKVFLLFFIFSLSAGTIRAQIILPFHLVDGYILVSAEVNGVKGKFIFDTGTPLDFMINNNLIPLEKNNFLSSGKAGSGQVLDVYRSDIDQIKIKHSPLEFKNLKDITHTDFSFMQDSIAPDVLGTIGYDIMKDYVITIDYNRQVLRLDSLAGNMSDFKRIATFRYDNEGNFPEVIFTASNGKKIPGYFDTGSQGVIKCTKSFLNELSDDNLIKIHSTGIWYGYAVEGLKSYSIADLSYNNIDFHLKHLWYIQGNENRISLGYSFLKDYISVWDFKNKSIIIYEE